MFPVPFGSLKIGAHEGRRASSVGLFKQSLFPWRPPFPFIVLLYGSRARNAYSVTCSVLKRNKTKQKKQHQPVGAHIAFAWTNSCVHLRRSARAYWWRASCATGTEMLPSSGECQCCCCCFYVDVNRLPRFAAPPLPGIQLHATVIFFFFSWHLQEISPFRSLVFLEIMPSPARGVLVRLSVSRRVSRANFCIPLSQMLSAAYVYTDFE